MRNYTERARGGGEILRHLLAPATHKKRQQCAQPEQETAALPNPLPRTQTTHFFASIPPTRTAIVTPRVSCFPQSASHESIGHPTRHKSPFKSSHFDFSHRYFSLGQIQLLDNHFLTLDSTSEGI
jgi:hypothetical protein